MRTQAIQAVRKSRQAISDAIATLRARRTENGQSLIEFTLVLPIFILLLMAAGEFGLTLREQTGLTQAVQQAAQYLAEHPAISGTSTCARQFPTIDSMATAVGCTTPSTTTSCAQRFATLHNISLGAVPALGSQTGYDRRNRSASLQETVYGECSSYIVDSYLQEHGFSAPGMSVYVDFSVNNFNQQQDTISVVYPYQLALPLFDRINACPASPNSYGAAYPKGAICLGVSVSVTGATEAPTITNVLPGSDGTYDNQPVIQWNPPYNPSGVSLTYNVYNCVNELSLPQCELDPAPQLDVAGTTGGASCSSASTASACSATDTTCSNALCQPDTYRYEITAVQPDTTDSGTDPSYGIESPRSQYIYGGNGQSIQYGGPGS